MTMTAAQTAAHAMLQASGYACYFLGPHAPDGDGWRCHVGADLIPALRRDCYDEALNPLGRFQEGCVLDAALHTDLGSLWELADFRSIRGVFGRRGSLQIVVNTRTLVGYYDVDRYSPLDDVVGACGHLFGEVIPHALTGLWHKLRGKR